MSGPHPLTPMLTKIEKRGQLNVDATTALLNLPFHIVQHPARAVLAQEGAACASCAVLVSGIAYRSKMAGSGAIEIISVHLPGDFLTLQFGLVDHLDFSVHTLTPAAVASIPHSALRAAADANPDIAHALWRDVLVESSICREWLLNVSRRNARSRIAHLFCELALRLEAVNPETKPIYHWPMTQEQMSDTLGLTPVHFNRTLRLLREEGLVSITDQTVHIHDWPGLRRVGDFNPAYLHLPSLVAEDKQPRAHEAALSHSIRRGQNPSKRGSPNDMHA